MRKWQNGIDIFLPLPCSCRLYQSCNAQDNPLAVYERRGSSLIWKEQDLYGSSRLGMAKPEREMTGFFWQSASYTLVAGARSYELSNHLGNVLAVVSDRGELQSAQDYFPFGMAMPGRSDGAYRYGFNGKEIDLETGLNDFGARLYDNRLGRWLAVDPLAAKHADFTPYNYVKNSPLIYLDPDGKDNIVYLYALPGVDPNVVKATQKKAQEHYKTLGLNVDVVVYTGNALALNYITKSDAVGVLAANRQQAADFIKKNLGVITAPGYEKELTDWAKAEKENIIPELSDGTGGFVFPITINNRDMNYGLDAMDLDNKDIQKENQAKGEIAALITIHSTGHLAKYRQIDDVNNQKGTLVGNIYHSAEPSLMSDGTVWQTKVGAKDGYSAYDPNFNTLSDFVKPAANQRELKYLRKKFSAPKPVQTIGGGIPLSKSEAASGLLPQVKTMLRKKMERRESKLKTGKKG